MLKAVIFDMDGVIIDSEPLHMEAWRRLLEMHGIDTGEVDFHDLVGKGEVECFKSYNMEGNSATLISEKQGIYKELLKDKLAPFPGVIDLIKTLHKKFVLAVASNDFRENSLFALDRLKLRNYFRVIVGKEDVRHPKPDPEMYLMTAERLGMAPSSCLVIEDSIVGVEAAKSAGMKCIAVANSFLAEKLGKADVVIKDIVDVNPDAVLIKA